VFAHGQAEQNGPGDQEQHERHTARLGGVRQQAGHHLDQGQRNRPRPEAVVSTSHLCMIAHLRGSGIRPAQIIGILRRE
jgi:hypothetical protein